MWVEAGEMRAHRYSLLGGATLRQSAGVKLNLLQQGGPTGGVMSLEGSTADSDHYRDVFCWVSFVRERLVGSIALCSGLQSDAHMVSHFVCFSISS